MTSTINWGIIAYRDESPINLPKTQHWWKTPNCTPSLPVLSEKTTAFANQYHAPHVFGSYEEMTNCPDLDIVYIASPHVGHHPHALLFLKNKIPVYYCEKPLATNTKGQVKEMIETARRNNTFLMEAIWTRFIPVLQKL
ncbi:MAG: Gfo/Idh/MocA family oxidoreductase [Saprospiraceae bacterium]